MRLGPAPAAPDLDLERHVELRRTRHLGPHQLARPLHIPATLVQALLTVRLPVKVFVLAHAFVVLASG